MFLDSVCKYFTEKFYTYVGKGNAVILFVGSLYGLGIRVSVALNKELSNVPASILWNNLRSNGINSTLKTR